MLGDLFRLRRGATIAAMAVTALAAVGAVSIATGAIPGSSGKITGCFGNNDGGKVRVIDADSQTCKPTETSIEWPSWDEFVAMQTALVQEETIRSVTDEDLYTRIGSLATDFAPVPQRLTSLDSGLTQQADRLTDVTTAVREPLLTYACLEGAGCLDRSDLAAEQLARASEHLEALQELEASEGVPPDLVSTLENYEKTLTTLISSEEKWEEIVKRYVANLK